MYGDECCERASITYLGIIKSGSISVFYYTVISTGKQRIDCCAKKSNYNSSEKHLGFISFYEAGSTSGFYFMMEFGGIEMKQTGKTYTIREWLDIWIKEYAPAQRKQSTMAIYADARRRILLAYPNLGDMLLTDLTALSFERMLCGLADTYSKSTIRHMRSLFSLAYKAAIKAGICANNPIIDVQLPSHAVEKSVTALTQDEQIAFEASLSVLNLQDECALRTYLLTGLRLDELRQLRWKDWNQRQRYISVCVSKTQSGI